MNEYDPYTEHPSDPPQQPTGHSYSQAQGQGYYSAPSTNGKAIAAMVLGIISIPTCCCYGVPAIICGALGLIFSIIAGKEIAQGGYTEGSNGMNLAGKICSIIGLCLGLVYIVFFIIMLAIGATQSQQQQQQSPFNSPSYPYNTPAGPTHTQTVAFEGVDVNQHQAMSSTDGTHADLSR